ncbi:TonB-dependent receptor [Olivibacter sp. SDN3]|uniref:TonB-dependent receptor n=1 Tax=Olivibacter sp. SDN3 TaxID=2764720 RepID=UPI0016518C25|nr:TonB-dependent receptor [Olivibacter sp. SDN3]QNL51432.1 TonB-dependent receptor [Olivibacter sp. SDN3]
MKKILLFFLPVLCIGNKAFAQNELEGIVRNGEGKPVMHATVSIKGSNVYTVADTAGHFNIETREPLPLTLLIKSVGYKSLEVPVETFEAPLDIVLGEDNVLNEVVITSRRRKELLQDVPIPISVVTGELANDAGAFNVNRLKEMVPSVQLYSSNPRNTGLSIRGLGTTFGLTNDGIDPGVGFYVDGVYYARTAATTLDFIDVEQIEVLRGPQGTLFGKNTVAGAFNVTTRKPSFTPGATFETSFGNYGFIQTKASVTGPLAKNVAARFSFSGTQRDGLLYNVATQKPVNDLNNLGLRGQLLFTPSDKVEIILAGDFTRQRPDGYAQVFAGVAPTLRPEYRQFEQIIADLGYELPSRNPFDRLIDHDTPWRSGQDLGGASVNVDVQLGSGTLTSTTAWRFWNWDPSNDRDFTGLQGLALSQAPSRHDQWSQEVRWAGTFSSKLSGVFGVFAFGQRLRPDPAHTEEAGRDQWRFSQDSESPLWQTPGLFEGFGIRSYPNLNTFSGAIFGQLDWSITDRLSLLPGIRLNYDDKKVSFRREPYGGLETDDPELIALKNSLYSAQEFEAEIDDTNLSGQLTLAFKATDKINTFATYSTGFKPVGLNLGGLPNANGAPMVELAVIRPERVRHVEIGIKTSPTPNSALNLTVYNTDVKDFQAQVQAADLSVNRGYLANAEKVRVRGVEFDANVRFNDYLSVYGALAYTDGKFVSFTNAPPPLEETGGPTFKDISGGQLPGISKWAGSLGGEVAHPGKFFGKDGQFFLAFDTYYRSSFSSNPSPSSYLVIDGYALLNARFGFRVLDRMSIFLWGRNLLDKDYFEQLLPGAGNTGHYAAVLGDQRTYGATLRYSF